MPVTEILQMLSSLAAIALVVILAGWLKRHLKGKK